MVNAFPPDRTDQPFGIGILPRRSRRGRSISDAHRPNTPGEYLAIGTIPVVDEVLLSPLPAACLSELVGDPLCQPDEVCDRHNGQHRPCRDVRAFQPLVPPSLDSMTGAHRPSRRRDRRVCLVPPAPEKKSWNATAQTGANQSAYQSTAVFALASVLTLDTTGNCRTVAT